MCQPFYHVEDMFFKYLYPKENVLEKWSKKG